MGNLLYQKGHNYISLVNGGDSNALLWGDEMVDKRLFFMDELTDDSQRANELSNWVKLESSRHGSFNANVKGRSKVSTNAFNIALATNHKMGIPLDSADDRRVYPLELTNDCLTDKDTDILKKIKEEIPMVNEWKYTHFMQKVFNHLYCVYSTTKSNNEIHDFLNARVPKSEFKNELMLLKSNKKNKLFNSLKTAKNHDDLLSCFYGELTSINGDYSKGIINKTVTKENIIIVKNESRLFIPATSLNELGMALYGSNTQNPKEMLKKRLRLSNEKNIKFLKKQARGYYIILPFFDKI